jgi:uncharacterized membrane protein (DUF485 family)
LTGLGKTFRDFNRNNKKKIIMKVSNSISNLLFYVGLIFLIAWAIGFLGYNSGGLFHILLGVAIFLLLFRALKRM